jgi:hypothetical protein
MAPDILKVAALVVASMLASGCAGAAPRSRIAPAPPTHSSPSAAADAADHWVAQPEPRADLTSRTLQPGQSIVVGDPAPPPEPTRPARRGRVKVSFHQAGLENALNFLADAGRFNLVVESGLSGSVSATLRDVDPYDALVTIAQANGAEVQYERRIVVVRRRTP